MPIASLLTRVMGAGWGLGWKLCPVTAGRLEGEPPTLPGAGGAHGPECEQLASRLPRVSEPLPQGPNNTMQPGPHVCQQPRIPDQWAWWPLLILNSLPLVPGLRPLGPSSVPSSTDNLVQDVDVRGNGSGTRAVSMVDGV